MNYHNKLNSFIFAILIAMMPFLTINLKAEHMPDDSEVNISLSNIEIRKLVELFSKIEKKNILIPSNIQGRVNFISSRPVRKDEIFEILLNVLGSKGYTIVQDGNFLKVVKLVDAVRSNLRVYHPTEYVSSTGEMITKQIALKHSQANIIAAKIRQFLSKTGRLVTIKENNTIIISDYPRNIKTIEKIIYLVEKDRKKVVDFLPIKHAKLHDIYSQATSIAKSLFNQAIPYNKIKILENKELNGLVIVGIKDNVIKLKNILKKLDKERIKEEETTEIVALKNIDANSAFKTLSQVIAKRKYKDPSKKPNISYSKEINAIILIGNPDIIKPIKATLAELDKEKYQVYVQAKIIEISDTKAKQIGIKYGLGGGVGSSSSLLTFASNFGSSALVLPEGLQISDVVDTSNLAINLALGAAISFLETNGASKTISNPSVLCVNNLESSIYVGKNKSFLVGKTTNASGTTTNYQREDIGLTLKVKPRVASRDKVTLEVNTILENVDQGDTNTNADRPTTTKQEVKTQVIVSNGESIIIGGLIETRDTLQKQKIPLLGDIPLLGAMFRHKRTTEEKKSIAIILTPYIIEKSSSLGKLQHFLAIYGQIQNEYNKKIFKKIKSKNKEEDDKQIKKKDKINNNPATIFFEGEDR
jgi:general secretion pathway protein D